MTKEEFVPAVSVRDDVGVVVASFIVVVTDCVVVGFSWTANDDRSKE